MDAATLLGIGATNLVIANPTAGVIPKEKTMGDLSSAVTPAQPGVVGATKKVLSFSTLKEFGWATGGFVGANLTGAAISAATGAEGNTRNWTGAAGSAIFAAICAWRGWKTMAVGAGLNLVRNLAFGIIGWLGGDPEDRRGYGLGANKDMVSILNGLGVGTDEAAELLNDLSPSEAEQLLGALAEMSPDQLAGLAGDEPSAVLNGEPSAVLNGPGANDLLERLLAAA